MATALSGIRACVFDAYGTLLDYASATEGCRNVFGDRLGPLTALRRDNQLQYIWMRSLRAGVRISSR
jgi:2-haloacid dehalogenase